MSDSDVERPSDDVTPDSATPVDPAGDAEEEKKWPFGFILTIAMVTIYLVYRLIQGLLLLFQWMF